MPFRLHVNPNCDPAQWGGNVNGSLLSRQLYQNRVMERRARPQLCLREILDVLLSRAHRRMSNLTQLPGLFNEAGDGHRPNMTKKRRVTKIIVTTQIALHRHHPMTSLASMASLVLWVHTVANSANVDDCCSGVSRSASSSMVVNGVAASNCPEHAGPRSTI